MNLMNAFKYLDKNNEEVVIIPVEFGWKFLILTMVKSNIIRNDSNKQLINKINFTDDIYKNILLDKYNENKPLKISLDFSKNKKSTKRFMVLKELKQNEEYKILEVITLKSFKERNYIYVRNSQLVNYVVSDFSNPQDFLDLFVKDLQHNLQINNKDFLLVNKIKNLNSINIMNFEIALYNAYMNNIYPGFMRALKESIDLNKFSFNLQEELGDIDFEKFINQFKIETFEDFKKLFEVIL